MCMFILIQQGRWKSDGWGSYREQQLCQERGLFLFPVLWTLPLPAGDDYRLKDHSRCHGSKREEWSDFRAKSDQSARRVSSLAIDCLRSPSPSCFFHQRFVNWHIKGRTKRNHPSWSRRGTSGISQAPHQNWLAESPVGKPRRTGYMLISLYHRRMALKEV